MIENQIEPTTLATIESRKEETWLFLLMMIAQCVREIQTEFLKQLLTRHPEPTSVLALGGAERALSC